VALKPEPVTPSAAETKAMPQATIKLQPAPAAAARKKGDAAPAAPATTPKPGALAKAPEKSSGDHPEGLKPSVNPDEEEEATSSASELPLPLVLAAALLALAAFGIQLWTFLA
jgi:hypothetical protein